MEAKLVATRPFEGQRPGTSGLRKKVKVFAQPHYLAYAVRALHDLRARGWQTAVLHIVDDAEVDPNAASAWLHRAEAGQVPTSIELIDRESGATLRLSPDDEVAERYAAAVRGWLEALEAACVAEETCYARVSTAWGIDERTISLLHERGLVA